MDCQHCSHSRDLHLSGAGCCVTAGCDCTYYDAEPKDDSVDPAVERAEFFDVAG